MISTALVESYRQDGKIRHRLIANLHGAESLVAAVGRLAAEREAVRKERAELESSIPHAEEFYQVITTAVRNGHVWSLDERKEIDRLLRDRKRLLKRMTAIDKQAIALLADDARNAAGVALPAIVDFRERLFAFTAVVGHWLLPAGAVRPKITRCYSKLASWYLVSVVV